MDTTPTFILDFDSTLVRVETLPFLADACLPHDADGEARRARIVELTDAAMEGRIDFAEALAERLRLLNLHRSQLLELAERLVTEISPSFARNRDFLRRHAQQIHILSSGFHELIEPLAAELGLLPEQVHANRLLFDEQGLVTGCDQDSPLSRSGGKVELLRTLALPGRLLMVGDGWSDLEVAEAGLVERFYAFTENVRRDAVLSRGGHEAPSFDEVLFDLGLRGALSYPRNRLKVLLLENIHAEAAAAFVRQGYSVETLPKALSKEELLERIAEVSIIGIRSKTQLTAEVVAKAKRLVAVGAFCIGTNQIDLQACRERGIAVFNAPYSNTRSVVELAMAEIVLLLRGLPEKIQMLHNKVWDKSIKLANEVRGKTLGIIGYGNIGMQLSVVAESFGMRVVFFDLDERLALGTARKAGSLKELLGLADVVSLHVDGRPENRLMFGAEQFGWMKPGAILLNLSRGHVVDLQALAAGLESGHVRGAAVDVFPAEPASNGSPFEHPLQDFPNVILTPHIGGSTQEAQVDIGRYVSHRLGDYIDTGSTEGSFNFPVLKLPPLHDAHRLIHIHTNQPGVLARINEALSKHGVNILGQYLKTDEGIGYVITDIDRSYSDDLLATIRSIPHTLRFRVLY